MSEKRDNEPFDDGEVAFLEERMPELGKVLRQEQEQRIGKAATRGLDDIKGYLEGEDR